MTPRTSAQGRSTRTASATTSVEDYAKTIYGLAEWDDAAVTASALARTLGVSNPSVTLMVRKMADLGLVDHQPYAPIRLTEQGRQLALAMVRRHRLIETWLVRELGYGWDEVHEEAERLEHAVSENFVDRLDSRLGHPRVDPHGDPIPGPDLSMDYPDTELLCRVPAASAVRLEQVDDGVPDALRILAEQDMEIGAQVQVTASDAGDVVVARTGAGEGIRLAHELAHAMRVSVVTTSRPSSAPLSEDATG
ncbi:metal-dependent transcriptional regulator [Nesterenkonia xinjiangensis]|uniref:Manganese transport regulator n=1 Tax=Nesterenkonia xinjiangensis TaxID=225327 RepID=A0A7Z0GND0_9MICC|nr:metal-dependent transcriptional regulator [Nesterenkonia xinjiangensis]NYJ79200.1 DtxR family Mn-dependent transcriptional regulator [Nesterenkonia xinjiangensis]